MLRCYGCASAATEHCITLLRALATNAYTRQVQCDHGLIRELVDYNLRQGSIQVCLKSSSTFFITLYPCLQAKVV